MKIILKKHYEYILFQKNNNLILSVLCGSVALYLRFAKKIARKKHLPTI